MTKNSAQQLRLLADSRQSIDRFSAKWLGGQGMPAQGPASYEGRLYRHATFALFHLGENPRWCGTNAIGTTFWWDGTELQSITMEELLAWERVCAWGWGNHIR